MSIAFYEKLRARIGADAVHTDGVPLDAASHDTWPLSTKEAQLDIHRFRPDAVVTVSDMAEVPYILALANEHGVSVTTRALASSVTGQPLPTRGGIVLDLAKAAASHRLNELDMTVTATASHAGGSLEEKLNAQGYTLGHSPQSLYRSTVGGWLATLATGQFSSYYGGIEDLVVGYSVVLASGDVIELKASPRAAMGPDLRQIFIGSEGTLGVITEVTLKVFPLPANERLGTFALPSLVSGLDAVRELTQAGLRPSLLRLYDRDEARHAMQDPSFSTPVLFLGCRGQKPLVEAEWTLLKSVVEAHGGGDLGDAGAVSWMKRRFDFSAVEELLEANGGFAETIEVAHNWSGISSLYHALKSALAPMADEVLGHFSHVYTQGTSLYMILLGHAKDNALAVERLRAIWDTAMRICLQEGGELSHHHGGGLVRSPYARESLGSAHLVLRRIKQALDPNNILNPGKLGL